MICTNCKSYIPYDSKFCPDCGTPVVNIEELRDKAKEITIQYKKGYNFYVNNGILPQFVCNLTSANCEKIIAMKTEINIRHLLLENEELKKAEEKRQIKETEEKRIRDNASGITIAYAKAYDYYVNIGVLPRFVHNLDITKCKEIIAKRDDIIAKHLEIQKQERAAEKIDKEQSTLYVLNELNRLGITDSDKRTLFLEHPERIKSKYWINYAKGTTGNNGTNNTQSGCMLIFMFLLSSALSLATIVKLLIF